MTDEELETAVTLAIRTARLGPGASEDSGHLARAAIPVVVEELRRRRLGMSLDDFMRGRWGMTLPAEPAALLEEAKRVLETRQKAEP